MTNYSTARSLLVGALLLGSCGAFAQQSSNFVKTPYLGAGSAVIEPSNGGTYVYGERMRDARIPSPAIMVSSPARIEFVLFSAQEESDLWSYKQSQLERSQQEEIDRLTKAQAQAQKQANIKYKSIKWPKVVLRGDSVCVPLVDFSESGDWRDHLTCTEQNTTQMKKESMN